MVLSPFGAWVFEVRVRDDTLVGFVYAGTALVSFMRLDAAECGEKVPREPPRRLPGSFLPGDIAAASFSLQNVIGMHEHIGSFELGDI